MTNNSNKYVVSILGSKGGSAKTLNSHILAHGLSIRKFQALLATSDDQRIVREHTARLYSTYNAQTDEALNKLFKYFINAEVDNTALLIVDGGASRNKFDVAVAQNSSLVLIPFLKDYEDIEVAIKDVENLRHELSNDDFANVRLLPSRFPTNPFLKSSTNDLFKKMFSEEHIHMMLNPVIEMSAAAKLNRKVAEEISSDVKRIARDLADDVLTQIMEDPFQYRERKF